MKNGLEDYYVIRGNKKMRFGYTTGSCAAAACKGAAKILLGGVMQKDVTLMTPKGILLTRQPVRAITGFIRACGLYVKVIANWRTYQRQYRKAFATMVSPEWWQRYFTK